MAFAVALFCSGLSSSTVGTMAGQVILQGFMNFRISIFARRLVTMIPAVVVIAWGLDPLKTLVLSQAVLSFCLPFAMIPLLMLTRRKDLMGVHANRPITNYSGRARNRCDPVHEYLAALRNLDWEILTACGKIPR